MKTLYSLVFMAIVTIQGVSAQTITAFTVVPANPTTADTITVYVQTDFPNSACEGQTFLTGISGSDINAGGLHCMGSFNALCTDIDTVVIPPLPAGQYTLHFMLTTGTSAGCIFGILPLVFDSTHFTVSLATGINDLHETNVLKVFPNPTTGEFVVKYDTSENSLLNVYSIEGRNVGSFSITGNETEINISLAPGVYTISIQDSKGNRFSRLIVK